MEVVSAMLETALEVIGDVKQPYFPNSINIRVRKTSEL
jgi:hypothetical protein